MAFSYMGANNRVKKDRVKKTLLIDKSLDDFMKANLELANASSENEFIRMALEFYIGFLKTKDTEGYLLNTLSSVLHSTIELSEERIIKYIYKMAIELGVLNRIVGIEKNLTETEFEKILQTVEREVKGW